MRIVIQRVSSAKVEVGKDSIGQIENGLLVFLGIRVDDTNLEASTLAEKMLKLRVFEKGKKIDQSVIDKGYEVLVVSQFTLMADTKKGNRPSFMHAADPKTAEPIYEEFILCLKKLYNEVSISSGKFGAEMKVSLVNDGPFTLIMES